MPHIPSLSKYRGGCRCDGCREIGSKSNMQRDRKIPRLPVHPMLNRFSSDDFSKKYQNSIDSWKTNGVNVFKIDEICCSMGMHPYDVYGDDWFLITLRGVKTE